MGVKGVPEFKGNGFAEFDTSKAPAHGTEAGNQGGGKHKKTANPDILPEYLKAAHGIYQIRNKGGGGQGGSSNHRIDGITYNLGVKQRESNRSDGGHNQEKETEFPFFPHGGYQSETAPLPWQYHNNNTLT